MTEAQQFFRCPDGGAAVLLKEPALGGECDLEPHQPCYAKSVGPTGSRPEVVISASVTSL